MNFEGERHSLAHSMYYDGLGETYIIFVAKVGK